MNGRRGSQMPDRAPVFIRRGRAVAKCVGEFFFLSGPVRGKEAETGGRAAKPAAFPDFSNGRVFFIPGFRNYPVYPGRGAEDDR